VGRPSKTEGFSGWVTESLRREPRLQTVELLRRARRAGYAGEKSAFYSLVSALRPRTNRSTASSPGLPPEYKTYIQVVRDCIESISAQFATARGKRSSGSRSGSR
jgi:hypothetical protein